MCILIVKHHRVFSETLTEFIKLAERCSLYKGSTSNQPECHGSQNKLCVHQRMGVGVITYCTRELHKQFNLSLAKVHVARTSYPTKSKETVVLYLFITFKSRTPTFQNSLFKQRWLPSSDTSYSRVSCGFHSVVVMMWQGRWPCTRLGLIWNCLSAAQDCLVGAEPPWSLLGCQDENSCGMECVAQWSLRQPLTKWNLPASVVSSLGNDHYAHQIRTCS